MRHSALRLLLLAVLFVLVAAWTKEGQFPLLTSFPVPYCSQPRIVAGND